jgi:predicted nucleotidyltransferase
MALEVSAEQMEQYRRTARARHQIEKKCQGRQREYAWQLARRAAKLLKEKYGVSRVVLFGSLLHPGRFTSRSDVDLAAWGLTSTNWLQAIAAVRNLSDQIELNLIDVTCCSPELLAVIEREGVPL